MLLLRKMPASYGFGEIFGVLVLAKSDLRFDSEDAAAGSHEERLDVSTIFAIVNLCDLLPDGTIFDFLGGAFEDYSLVGFFGADHAVRVGGDVLGLARTRPGAEPERVLPPDAPNKHEVRPAPWARGGDPIVVGLFEALEGPWPGLKASCLAGGFLGGVRPVGPAGLGFDHRASFPSTEMRRNCIRAGGMLAEKFWVIYFW